MNIHTIHAHWLIPQGFVAALYKKFFNNKINIICTSHGSDIVRFNSFAAKIIKRFTLRQINKMTVVSQYLKNQLCKLDTNTPIDVFPMGVDMSEFHPKKYSEEIKNQYNVEGPMLIFAGRLSAEKGVERLLEAMPSVLENFPQAKLLIIGSGIIEKKLKNLSVDLGISNNTIFTGYIEKSCLPKYYATADILILPSLYEGFGLTLIEALACECNVIASDLPVLRELFDQENQDIILRADNSREISSHVSELLNNKSLKNDLRQRGRQYVEKKFDWNEVTNKYSDLLLST